MDWFFLLAKVLLPLPNGLHECTTLSGCHKIGTEVLGTWSSVPHQLLIPAYNHDKHTQKWHENHLSFMIHIDHCMSRLPFSRPPVLSLDHPTDPTQIQDLQQGISLRITEKGSQMGNPKWIQGEYILRYKGIIYRCFHYKSSRFRILAVVFAFFSFSLWSNCQFPPTQVTMIPSFNSFVPCCIHVGNQVKGTGQVQDLIQILWMVTAGRVPAGFLVWFSTF